MTPYCGIVWAKKSGKVKLERCQKSTRLLNKWDTSKETWICLKRFEKSHSKAITECYEVANELINFLDSVPDHPLKAAAGEIPMASMAVDIKALFIKYGSCHWFLESASYDSESWAGCHHIYTWQHHEWLCNLYCVKTTTTITTMLNKNWMATQ